MAFALKGAGSASTDWSITANQASFVLTTSTTAGAANDLAVLMYAVDNNATADGDEGAVTGIVDSAGNFWQKAVEFTNGQGTLQTGATNGIWYCNLQNALAVGATITLTFSNATSRDASAVSLTYFTKAAGFKATINGTPGTLANDAANAGSLDVTTDGNSVLRIRSIASETSVATAITKTAAFTAVLTQAISTGGAATGNQGVRGEYLVASAINNASAPTGGGGTVDHASVYVAFQETAFTVGDPPHNSDQVAGAAVARFARKAVTATLIAASAGLFLPPMPPPAVPALTAGIPVTTGSTAPRARKVYYQSNFTVPYAAPAAAVTPAKEGWQAPLSVAANPPNAQQGFVTGPFGPPLVTTLDWQAPLSIARPPAKAQAGYSFVPFNTVQTQYAANYTNLGWYAPLAGAPAVAQAWQGDSFAPYNTAQGIVAYSTAITIPLDAGGAGPRLRQTYYQSRFDAPYVAPAAADTTVGIPLDSGGVAPSYRTVYHQSLFEPPFQLPPAPQGWYRPLSPAPAVAKAQVGFSFVPFDTTQHIFTYSTATGIPLDMGGAAPRQRQTYYQSRFQTPQPPYVPPTITDVPIPLDIGGVAPSYRTVFHQSLFEPPFQLPPAPQGWYVPLQGAPKVAKPQVGFSFVPFNTTQFIVTYSTATAIPLDMGGAAPRLRQTYYQAKFEPLYVAPVAVAGIAGIAWFSPLGTIPARTLAAPQGHSFVPYNTAQVVATPYTAYYQQPLAIAVPVARAAAGFWFVPYNTVQVAPPSELGGTTSLGGGGKSTGGFCRKKWKKCLEEIRQQLADEQASLKAAKARHEEIDYAARAARIAAIQASAAALEAECAAESLAVASARIERFIDKLARIEADYQAALLRQFEDDEDDVLTILLT